MFTATLKLRANLLEIPLQMSRYLTMLLCGATLLAGCAEEPPPRTAAEFVENPILLEAAMVRCSQDRQSTRYDQECINAREAVKRIEAKEEAARRAALEQQSEEKRRALRRTQEAAAAARRRAAEERQRREEEEYLAQFGVPMPRAEDKPDTDELSGNTPIAVIPESQGEEELADYGEVLPASDGGNAPALQTEPDEPESDLAAIRDELQRRNEDGN